MLPRFQSPPVRRIAFLAVLMVTLLMAQPARAQDAVVRAVLLFSPGCGHCHQVMTEVLPPLKEQYGDQLVILEVDVTTDEGQAFYMGVLEQYQTPQERRGVPTLIVGDAYLVGSGEIPEQLPGLIASGLAAGGFAWPKISGLEKFIEQQGLGIAPAPVDASTDVTTDGPIWLQKFQRDPIANTVAVIVLAALVFSLVASLVVALSSGPAPAAKSWFTAALLVFALLSIPSILDLLQTQGFVFVLALVVTAVFAIQIAAPILLLAGKGEGPILKNWHTWTVPLISVAGVIVATYLAFIEATQGTPICGPVGDCGTVQESEYAMIFGVLPVGVLGLAGYVAILIAWLAQQFGPAALKNVSGLAMWGMSIFGVLFSAYLTFLEPFVIGATCMWCITSAVLMILMLWVTTPGAKAALTVEEEV
jgi:uncharacterized membrane protein